LPTFDVTARFMRDYETLSRRQQSEFAVARRQFCEDLAAGRGFRKGLRVKGVRGRRGVYEMTWADDGRATFEYGSPRRDGHTHVMWRRIGRHAIFADP